MTSYTTVISLERWERLELSKAEVPRAAPACWHRCAHLWNFRISYSCCWTPAMNGHLGSQSSFLRIRASSASQKAFRAFVQWGGQILKMSWLCQCWNRNMGRDFRLICLKPFLLQMWKLRSRDSKAGQPSNGIMKAGLGHTLLCSLGDIK